MKQNFKVKSIALINTRCILPLTFFYKKALPNTLFNELIINYEIYIALKGDEKLSILIVTDYLSTEYLL